MLASPASSFAAPRLFRPLWLLWVFVLIAPALASAASPPVIADFDGDSKPDRAELSRREPSAVRVWLSTTRRVAILRSSTPILGIAARDLDGDRRAELIASKASSGLQVWTKRRHGFGAFRPKRITPNSLARPARHSVHDGPADAGEATDQEAPKPPASSPAPGAPFVALTFAPISTHVVVVPESSTVFAPFGPRPPPLSH